MSEHIQSAINEMAEDVHNLAIAKGWYETKRQVPELIALCHSELSEALEEYRSKSEPFYGPDGKPEGIVYELADCVIRIFDMSVDLGFDIGSAIVEKHAYNKTRPYRHGGKRC